MATRLRFAEAAARHSSGKPGLPADVVIYSDSLSMFKSEIVFYM